MAKRWNFKTEGKLSSTAAVHIPYDNPGNSLISDGKRFSWFSSVTPSKHQNSNLYLVKTDKTCCVRRCVKTGEHGGKNDRQYTYNVKLRRVRVTTVTV